MAIYEAPMAPPYNQISSQIQAGFDCATIPVNSRHSALGVLL